MPVEYCPHCSTPRNLRQTVTRRSETAADGTTKTIETTSYQCEGCHAFVRSEEAEVIGPGTETRQ